MIKTILLTVLLFLSLIFHKEVIAGASYGLLLWYQALIPALFPFIIITNTISSSHSYETLTFYLKKKIPDIYIFISFLLGNLCGYPIGAKILNDFVNYGYIGNKEANRLLAVVSQASPMFLIGFVYQLIPDGMLALPAFLFLMYTPSILFFVLILISGKTKNDNLMINTRSIPNKDTTVIIHNNDNGSLIDSAKIMVTIGIYVIIFSIVSKTGLHLIERCSIKDPFFLTAAKCSLSMLEITNGLKLIENLSISDKYITALIMFLSSFGGLCTAFQIKGVLNYEKNTIKKYLCDKLIIATGTLFLTLIYIKN